MFHINSSNLGHNADSNIRCMNISHFLCWYLDFLKHLGKQKFGKYIFDLPCYFRGNYMGAKLDVSFLPVV